MLTARKYLNRCSQLTNQLLDKVHLISLALIIPSGLAVYLGLVIERKLRITRYWKVIESTSSTPKKYSQARNQAFEGLVKAGVSLIDTDFKEINLSRAHLKSANLEHTNLEGAILECAHLERANLNRANLNSTNLKGANLNRAFLESGNLNHAFLETSDLRGAILNCANLKGVNLNRADLGGANLSDANLNRADLEGADLRGAILETADLESANFRSREVTGVGLTIARSFSGQLFVSVIYQDTPALKAGLKKGSRIATLNGKKTEVINIDEAYRLLFDEPGTQVTLTIERYSKTQREYETKDYSLTVRSLCHVRSRSKLLSSKESQELAQSIL